MRNGTIATGLRGKLVSNLRLITIGGCLCMVFVVLTGSPLTTDFLRESGGTEFHFGLLSGIPMILISFQFLGAYVTGRIRFRKVPFILSVIVARMAYLPAAFLPLVLPAHLRICGVYIFIVCVSVYMALTNFSGPLWLSWMGDLIPEKILNRYWAERHRYLQIVWTITFLAVALIAYVADHLPTRTMFPLLATVGVAAGVTDIILFAWVHEPHNMQTKGRHFWDLLTEPIRHVEYRSFLSLTCAFAASSMFAAGFMQIYVLKVLQVPRWKTSLIWCMVGLGSVFIARLWGRLADRHGHRPILIVCISLKSLICVVFLLVTAANAFPVLLGAFFFDSMLNAGYFIALNGYKLKMSPRENRSMFIAATLALSGLAGGSAAIISGWLLRYTETLSIVFAGRTWINYHLIFLISMAGRLLCIPLALAVREPKSSSPVQVLSYLLGRWPMRVLTLPVGLYKRRKPNLSEDLTE